MDVEELVDEIMEIVESEPDPDYGDPQINEAIRNRGVRARIQDLLEEGFEGPEELAEARAEISALEDETLEQDEKITSLENKIFLLEEELAELRGER